MHILRELWTEIIDEHEVKSSYKYVLDLRASGGHSATGPGATEVVTSQTELLL